MALILTLLTDMTKRGHLNFCRIR
uniref:Uncharacterized protein n=1 Tax=Arundo donax TaxID=35708 RepID=A0A0A9HUH4_ARUDO